MSWTPMWPFWGSLSTRARWAGPGPASVPTPFATRPGRTHTPTRWAAQRDAEGIFYLDLGDELLRGMADCGDVTVVPSDVLKNFEKLTRAVEKIVDRRGVLHSHGSPIRRCRELPLVNHITSIGIRSARRKAYEESQRDSSLIISTARFRDLGPAGVADLVPRAENLYITLDIDLLNPSQAPGTGTPEVGGLFYQETRECLEALVGRSNLVGFDLVEVAPPYDSSEITSQIAARLIVDILAARFPSK